MTPGAALHGYGNEQRRAIAHVFFSPRQFNRHIGLLGEITYLNCEGMKALRIHDGVTPGGCPFEIEAAEPDICELADQLPEVGYLQC